MERHGAAAGGVVARGRPSGEWWIGVEIVDKEREEEGSEGNGRKGLSALAG